MFQFTLTILCAVVVVGYLFFSTGTDREDAPAGCAGGQPGLPESHHDAA